MENGKEPPKAVEEACDSKIHYLSEERSIVAFKIPEQVERVEDEEADDFYELTLNEAKKIYMELQKTSKELTEAPLLTKKKREELEKENEVHYTLSLVRVEFPDRTVLQAVFSPEDKVATLAEVIALYVTRPPPLTFFTAPPRVELSAEWSLREAGLVPSGKVYCKAGEEDGKPYLKEEVVFSDHLAASKAASLARARESSVSRNKNKLEEEDKKPENGQGSGNRAPRDPAALLKFLSKPSTSSLRTS